MPVDTECVGQSEGNLAAMFPGDINAQRHRGLWFVGVPQIAFEIENRTACDKIGIDRSRGQELRCTQKGVHRPLCIRRNKNQAARRWRLFAQRRHIKIDAGRTDIMSENFTQLIVGHLRDQGALAPQYGCAGKRVGTRTATNFPRRPHVAI